MICKCALNGAIEIIGLCNTSKIDLTEKAWTEISIPVILKVPEVKPDIESIEKVFEDVKIISKRVVDTPNSYPGPGETPIPNEEGLILTGKKLIVEGILEQKIVYTADKPTQPVHSAHFCVPFSAFIIIANPINELPTTPLTPPPEADEFCVDTCVEDVYIKLLTPRKFFKNVTLLLNARKVITC
jgi:hypothetical protein